MNIHVKEVIHINGKNTPKMSGDEMTSDVFYKSNNWIYNNPSFVHLYASHLFNERTPPIRREMEKFVGTLPVGGSILDVGCGTGKDVAYLRTESFLAYGVDISTPMIQIARKSAKGDYFIRCDFRNLNCLRFHTFDGILCLASIQHAFRSDIGMILNQMNLALQDGGTVLIITKEGHGLYMDKRLGEGFPRPTTLVSREELWDHLVEQGFEVFEFTSFELKRDIYVDNWLSFLARKV